MLFLPFIAEVYWMFKMFGENDTYAYIALVHLILALPIAVFGRGERKNYAFRDLLSMACDRPIASVSLRDQFLFRWTRNCYKTGTSLLQSVL